MSGRTLKAVAILSLLWALVMTSLYLQQVLLPQRGSERLIRVDIGIKYKNGTVEWHNSTSLRSGATLLEATAEVAEVSYTEHPGMGCFVDSINGVRNEHPYYWIWWYWDRGSGWMLGPVAADKYALSDGEIVIWFYEDTSQYPPQKP